MEENQAGTFTTVCRVGDIPEGQARMLVVAETMLCLSHVEGQYFALANECPHAGASLAHGIIEGDVIRCRIHHWRFSIRDGVYLDEDKPQCNAQSFPVRIVGEEVQVAMPPDKS